MDKIEDLKINYLLSRNRSGSTLIMNILNHHSNLHCISELNIFWHLKNSYDNGKIMSNARVVRFVNDIYYVYNKKGNGFFELMLPSKSDLVNLIVNSGASLTYSNVCRIINLNIFNSAEKYDSDVQILKKEINLNHLLPKFIKTNSISKVILLVRNHRDNIASSLRFNAAIKNYVYEAKRWSLEMKPFINSGLKNHKIKVVSYEELITNTNSVLESIQQFLELNIDNNLDRDYVVDEKLIIESLKARNIGEEKIEEIIKFHLKSYSKVDKTKLKDYSNFFTKSEKEKIDFICRDIALKFGYECFTGKVRFSLKDRVLMMQAVIDHYIVVKYALLDVHTKKLLSFINIFKFYK